MFEVTTRNDLERALLRNEGDIHISDKRLTLDLLTRPQRYRRIFCAMQANRYRLIKIRTFGVLDLLFRKR